MLQFTTRRFELTKRSRSETNRIWLLNYQQSVVVNVLLLWLRFALLRLSAILRAFIHSLLLLKTERADRFLRALCETENYWLTRVDDVEAKSKQQSVNNDWLLIVQQSNSIRFASTALRKLKLPRSKLQHMVSLFLFFSLLLLTSFS